ncbi:MAG: sterol desaturase family protein, partial [Caulobacteraceae bacterium]
MADRGVRQRRPKLGEPGISFLLGRLLLVHRQRHGALRRDLEPERLELLHPAQLILDGDVGRAKRLVPVPQNAAMLTHLAPQFRAILPATALALMALEFGFARFAGRATHDLRESAASLGVAAGQLAVRGVEVGVVAAPAAFVYAHRLFHFEETSWLALLGLFVGGEFLYYWQHRAAHRVRWFWASHSVHHSATRLNLTAAIRLGWTAKISGMFLFFLPLALIGYSPLLLTAMLGFNLAYQFFIHTELAPRLG